MDYNKYMFEYAARYCNEAYSCEVEMENGEIIGFICPHCGELIYSEDWTDKETENWMVCPICFEAWSDDEEEEE